MLTAILPLTFVSLCSVRRICLPATSKGRAAERRRRACPTTVLAVCRVVGMGAEVELARRVVRDVGAVAQHGASADGALETVAGVVFVRAAAREGHELATFRVSRTQRIHQELDEVVRRLVVVARHALHCVDSVLKPGN